jgi:predicted adenylyl cyclase CyaB
MPRNIEIKARTDDRSALLRAVEAVADRGPYELHQTDTFFRCAEGRLTLREFGDSPGELISYQRADGAGPRESVYFVAPVPEPETTRRILSVSNGVLGVVKKRRLLYLVGQTRVHLDEVQGLGDFVELEVVLREGQSIDEGVVVANNLMRVLDIDPGRLIRQTYFDLLQERGA